MTANEKMHRSKWWPRWLQRRTFYIWAFIGVAAFFFISIFLHHWFWTMRQPLTWREFSIESLETQLDQGKDVLVVYYGHWKPRPLQRLEDSELCFEIHRRGIKTMVANLLCPATVEGLQKLAEMEVALNKIKRNGQGLPLAVLYRHDQGPPVVLSGFKKDDKIVKRLTDVIAGSK